MTKLKLRIATMTSYDHLTDLTTGAVEIPDVQATFSQIPIVEVFGRSSEWDVAEVSFGKFCELTADGSDEFVAIPVFLSRAFRHSSFYVAMDSPVESPGQLQGLRIGIPDWSQTAVIAARGILEHDYGVDLKSIEWVQAGLDVATVNRYMTFPDGYSGSVIADRSLSELLEAGEIDGIIAARAPQGFSESGGSSRRVIPDYESVERAYFARTNIFPIMHLTIVRRALVDQNPWLVDALVKGFTDARDNSIKRIQNIGISYIPFAWMSQVLADRQEVFGETTWPYSVEENRESLDSLLVYAYEQGVSSRRVEVDELF